MVARVLGEGTCFHSCAGARASVLSDSPEDRLRISTSTTMLRHYTPTLSVMWLALLLVLPLVSGHMIEVPASKKECFFEDLHVNDKVRPHSTLVWDYG